jgi:hypothetical protein
MSAHRPSRTRRAALVAALTAALTLTAGPAPATSPPRVDRATTSPADDGTAVGRWQVRPAGAGSWVVTWRSPSRLPVSSDRPTVVQGGAPIGVPTVRSDGRTVVTTVTSPTRPVPGDLDVVLSGARRARHL